MKRTTALFAFILLFAAAPQICRAQEQGQQKEMNVQEQAEKEAARLETLLEYWQVFRVDSLLNVNLEGYKKAMETLKSSGAQSQTTYYIVSDAWAERIDSAYMKVFNKDQWKKYQRSGALKAAKQRAKRRDNAKKSTEQLHLVDE